MPRAKENPNDNHCGEPKKKTNLEIYCHFKNNELILHSQMGHSGGKITNNKIENATPKMKPNISPLSKFSGKIVDKFI